MESRKRLLVGLVLITMGAGLLFGAGGSEPVAAESETLELIWLGWPRRGGSILENDDVKPIIEERFNVKIVKAPVANEDMERMALYFAEGKTADVMVNRMGRDVLVRQGIIRKISEDMLYEYMPAWMKMLEQVVGKQVIDDQLYYKDEVWGVPHTMDVYTSPFVEVMREDWLKSGGFAAPDTLDELFEVLKYFTFGDPDNNGKADTYGMGAAGTFGFLPVFVAFNALPEGYYRTDTGVIGAAVTDGYRDALSMLNQWYEAGVIDPEFMTTTWRDYKFDKWANGYLGTVLERATAMDANPNAANRLVIANNPDASAVALYGLTGPSGFRGVYAQYPELYIRYPYYFGRDTSDAKVLKGMEILEAACVDYEFYKRIWLGIEGKHYEVLPDGVFSALKWWTDVEEQDQAGLNFYVFPPATSAYRNLLPKSTVELANETMRFPLVYSGRGFGISEANSSEETFGEEVSRVVNEFLVNAITGQVDINDEWDAYKDRWYRSGGRQIIDEYNRMFQ